MAAQIIQICPPAAAVTASLNPRQIGGDVRVTARPSGYSL
jgi:hypothetical protein